MIGLPLRLVESVVLVVLMLVVTVDSLPPDTDEQELEVVFEERIDPEASRESAKVLMKEEDELEDETLLLIEASEDETLLPDEASLSLIV